MKKHGDFETSTRFYHVLSCLGILRIPQEWQDFQGITWSSSYQLPIVHWPDVRQIMSKILMLPPWSQYKKIPWQKKWRFFQASSPWLFHAIPCYSMVNSMVWSRWSPDPESAARSPRPVPGISSTPRMAFPPGKIHGSTRSARSMRWWKDDL